MNKKKVYMAGMIGRVIALSLLVLSLPQTGSADNEKILVFRDARPYDGHLPPVKAGIAMVREFGTANKFTVDTTVDLSSFNSANLAKYDAVLFMHPYRDVNGTWLNDTMNASEDSAFQRFMLSGKGLVGIHCADRMNNNSPWYLNLLGVQYLNDIGPQNCTYHVADVNHPQTAGVPPNFVRSQQVRCNRLFFSDTSKDFTVLIKADDKDYPAGQKQTIYPYVWMHDYKGARVWCGSMGHTPETFSSDTIWRKLMLRGILYALNRPGYGQATALKTPAPGMVRYWTTDRGRATEENVDVFDFSGRSVGRLPASSMREGLPIPGSTKLPSGMYIATPVTAKKGSAVFRMTP